MPVVTSLYDKRLDLTNHTLFAFSILNSIGV